MIESLFRHRLEHVRTVEDLGEHLELFLNSGCYFWTGPNGERTLVLTRFLVGQINGLTMHIFPREHAPPHFHVKSADMDATFDLMDCSLIEGSVDGKTRRSVVDWHSLARPKLIEIWNKTRPTDCPVGPIRDES